jgi:hypothetical protein
VDSEKAGLPAQKKKERFILQTKEIPREERRTGSKLPSNA